MGMVACAGEIENKKQDIFCVIQSTHNNYSADSLVLYALQVKIILYTVLVVMALVHHSYCTCIYMFKNNRLYCWFGYTE